MAQYEAARGRTRERIEQCFWELYTDTDFRRRVRVADITEKAGIHRSTFYMYFDSVDCIFDSIKDRQLKKLEAVCGADSSTADEQLSFLTLLEALFEENRTYLRPLLAEYHSSSFSIAYRRILKDKLRRDAEVPLYPSGTKQSAIVDNILGGMIEMLISTLDEPLVSVSETFPIARRMMEQGFKAAMTDMYPQTAGQASPRRPDGAAAVEQRPSLSL